MKVSLLVVAALVGSGCHAITPDAGQEAVLVKKPLVFGSGGVDPTPIKTGLSWRAISTKPVYVTVVPQQHAIHFDDLMSSDGVPLDFDAVIRLQVNDTVKLITSFGPMWFEHNVAAEFSNRVRQAVRKHGMNETAIQTTAVDAIDLEISQAMEAYIKQAGLPLKLIDVTVGRANPPDSVKNQRISTAEQEQRGNTERQRKLAEDQRLQAETSREAADNAYRNAMNLSPEQFLRLESIQMQRDVCVKGGCTFIAGDAVPIVQAR
jgi:regulator of protease activity HflC (stomatin/prohibitin superfamily)